MHPTQSLTKGLSIVKTVDNSSPDENTDVTYTIILTNSGPDDATGVSLVDVLPSGLNYLSSTGDGTFSASAGADAGTGGNISWSNISIANGETKVYTFTATVESSATLTASAEITASSQPDPDSQVSSGSGVDDWGDNIADDDEASVSITPGATDLSLFKSYVIDDGTLDTVGETVTFTLTVLNAGPKDAYNVQVKDDLTSIMKCTP